MVTTRIQRVLITGHRFLLPDLRPVTGLKTEIPFAGDAAFSGILFFYYRKMYKRVYKKIHFDGNNNLTSAEIMVKIELCEYFADAVVL